MLLISSSVFAQQKKCGTDSRLNYLLDNNPNAKTINQTLHTVYDIHYGKSANTNIPVVVHVVYKNTEENISDAQIISQIDVLNKETSRFTSQFRKLLS